MVLNGETEVGRRSQLRELRRPIAGPYALINLPRRQQTLLSSILSLSASLIACHRRPQSPFTLRLLGDDHSLDKTRRRAEVTDGIDIWAPPFRDTEPTAVLPDRPPSSPNSSPNPSLLSHTSFGDRHQGNGIPN